MTHLPALSARLALAGVALILACGSGRGGSSARVRDSAGVRIVEISRSSDAEPVWTAADPPSVDIGAESGDAALEFSAIVGVVRLGDGRLAVADRGSREIRLFDAGGRHLRSAGRAGSGPGEFQALVSVWSGPGDSLLALDMAVRRLSVFDTAGNFVRSFGLGGETGMLLPNAGTMQLAFPQGWLADGTIVATVQGFRFNDQRAGVFRDTLTAIRYGPDGAVRDTVGRFPAQETEQMTLTFGGQSMSVPQQVPLGRSTIMAAGLDRVYVATNDAWEIEVRAPDGRLMSLLRLDVAPVPLTAEDQEQHRKELIDRAEAQAELRAAPQALRDQILERIRSSRYPSTFAFIAGLIPDAAGNLWVQEVTRPGVDAQRFVVFDSSGSLIATARLPERFRATVVGTDHVAGIWRDPDDVEHVRVYRLVKSGSRVDN